MTKQEKETLLYIGIVIVMVFLIPALWFWDWSHSYRGWLELRLLIKSLLDSLHISLDILIVSWYTGSR